ncbi:MAG: DUF898 family protein [Caulobacteraceae bacterium]|nr:DUF898 family protein [Caulobacteraceae bacterium]
MTADAAPSQTFAHSGKFFNVLGLALKNAGLTIITLTMYRFWARTAMRRRLWSRTFVMGDPLEYTGSASELFRGFLISLPCFFLPAIFVFYIAPYAIEPVYAGWLTFGFYVLSVPLVAAARYWMRRYQLSRTRWRGIKLGLAGSAWGFATASWGWWVLQLLSLGWYTPAARINRARQMWENTRFGDQPFQFEVEHGESPQKGMWWAFAFGWVTFAIALVCAPIAAAFVQRYLVTTELFDSSPEAYSIAYGLIGLGVLLIWGLAWLICWAPYNAAAMNRIASLITIDGARFKLKARTISLFIFTLFGWLIVILSLGLLAPVAGFLQVRYILNRLELVDTPRFAEIGQSVLRDSDSGESLGDAFDLDMGVGVI